MLRSFDCIGDHQTDSNGSDQIQGKRTNKLIEELCLCVVPVVLSALPLSLSLSPSLHLCLRLSVELKGVCKIIWHHAPAATYTILCVSHWWPLVLAYQAPKDNIEPPRDSAGSSCSFCCALFTGPPTRTDNTHTHTTQWAPNGPHQYRNMLH